MLKAVHKYPLKLQSHQTIHLPSNYKIVHVGEQEGTIMLWAEVGKYDLEDTALTIHIYGTGHIHDVVSLGHLGTVQIGSFVWHVYLEKP